ncbi:DNA alkylation repair protein [Bacteroides sp. An322]|uniref:DNA alkylation repair protein n=1 Tax=Bacteroides sp. An322 TaxID=1965632 RepID=UPI000B398652|nr:DNA alkylation repair protein [Bacteroides sp. An322]OUO19079.1 hypothetical protein B5F91_08765 [Bacteroides sp. An322]
MEEEHYRLDGLTIKEHLLQLAERGNKKFTESLNPGVEHILGIRVPDLRKLAARIVKDDWEAYLDTADIYYMEERMLQGMVLGCIRPDADVEVYLHRVTQFVWNINSWSVCDTFKFGGGKKFIEANKDRLWEYLKTWMHAEGEYEIRFGVVMAMQHFIDEEHLDELFSLYDGIRHEGYYVRMAVAWALSVCFVKFPERTLAYLKQNSLDKFTYNKALQKITESYRVDAATKEVIRAMKR